MLLRLDSVSKSYERTLFSDFSLTISRGDRICVFGESGCGKTTLLNIILGLTKPDSGAVRHAESLRFSAVFQEDRLIEHLTGPENLFALSPQKGSCIQAESALVSLGIDPAELGKPVREWSGGMRRRAAIARAMLSGASLIAMDEPFTGLDSQSRSSAIKYIDSGLGSAALLLISHNEDDARALFCKRVEL